MLNISDSDLLVIKIENGIPAEPPMTYSNFRLVNNNVEFSNEPDNSVLQEFGYYRFRYIEKPIPTNFEHVVEGPIVFSEDMDAWCNTYVKVPFTTEEIEETKLKAYDLLRLARNQLLTATDWTQLPDAPISEEKKIQMRIYRQQLRDYMDAVADSFNPPTFPKSPNI